MRTKEEIYRDCDLSTYVFQSMLPYPKMCIDSAMEQYKLEFAIAIMQNVIQDLQGEMVTTGQMSSFRADLLNLQNQLNQIK